MTLTSARVWVAQDAVSFLHQLRLDSFVAFILQTESGPEVKFSSSVGLAEHSHASLKITATESF